LLKSHWNFVNFEWKSFDINYHEYKKY